MTYNYTMCGLDYVYLQSGYRFHDTDYGDGVSIERADDLDRAIAARIVFGLARLRGQEARFLRALTGFSQTEIANCLGVKRATVARWEGAVNTPIPGPSDRLLRLVSARFIWTTGEAEELEGLIDVLPQIANEKPAPITMSYTRNEPGFEETMFPNDDTADEGWKQANTA